MRNTAAFFKKNCSQTPQFHKQSRKNLSASVKEYYTLTNHQVMLLHLLLNSNISYYKTDGMLSTPNREHHKTC